MRERETAVAVAICFLIAACRGPQPIREFKQLTLERTTCYGWCPSYRVSLFADGRVTYEGKKFVKVAGLREKRVPMSVVSQVLLELERANYFALRDRYSFAQDGCPSVWTDNPAAITSLQANGKSKRIHHYYYGCQEDIETGHRMFLTREDCLISKHASTKS